MRSFRILVLCLALSAIAFAVTAIVPSCNVLSARGEAHSPPRVATPYPDLADVALAASARAYPDESSPAANRQTDAHTVVLRPAVPARANPRADERLLDAGIRGARLFPAALKPTIARALSGDEVHTVRLPGYEAELASRYSRLLLPWMNTTVFSYYGRPGSRTMGILGVWPKETVADMMMEKAREYDEVNGQKTVTGAFYLIYGGCWPGGDIGYVARSTMIEWIEYAASRNILVFVDHQIGKFGVPAAMEAILPFLKYPNVHLALDPEWSTLAPMVEIGSVTGEEINEAQAMMQAYMEREGIEGARMLVVHQFANRMIKRREVVRADFDKVLLVHVADGFGNPGLKRHSYRANAAATNMPLKGFKLFYPTDVPGAGWDDPLMTPSQVMSLSPQPFLVMYQ